jgi:hypothetical protein
MQSIHAGTEITNALLELIAQHIYPVVRRIDLVVRTTQVDFDVGNNRINVMDIRLQPRDPRLNLLVHIRQLPPPDGAKKALRIHD